MNNKWICWLKKLDMDPIEFRMKNIFRKGSMTATGTNIDTDSVPLDKCVEEVDRVLGSLNN